MTTDAKTQLLQRVDAIITGIEANCDAEKAKAQAICDAACKEADDRAEQQMLAVTALVTPNGMMPMTVHEEPPAPQLDGVPVVPPLPQTTEPGD